MDLLMMIVVGFTVGVIAKLVVPRRDPGGLGAMVTLGVAGALAAGLIGRELGWSAHGEAFTIFASGLGALLMLLLYQVALGLRPVRAT